MATKYINQASDLQTDRKVICEGFLEQAVRKSEKAQPVVAEARRFYKALKGVNSIDEFIAQGKHQDEMSFACGFSNKASNKLTEEELTDAIKEIAGPLSKAAGDGFREEFLYRFLLTKGDALGGSMRNVTGASAGKKLTGKITEKLSSQGKKPLVQKNASGKIQRIDWKNRTLLFDVKAPFVDKNVDVILFDSGNPKDTKAKLLSDKGKYIACGELKGGIDPAGADEHWKTANSALERIREAFRTKSPKLFFVGAAIEAAMAEEIFEQLNSGKLSYAANLTKNQQIDDLVDWLLSL